jgi:hypothetical protein
MALIIRGGREFYIRSVRRGGRVTSEYVGSGELAWLADARAQNLKAEREYRRRKLAAQLARWDRITAGVEAFVALADHVFRAAMEAAGFHQHKRGEWRKRRMNAIPQPPAEARAQMAALLGSLLVRVKAGDKSAVPALDEALARCREFLPKWPEADDVDPGKAVEKAVVAWAAGKDSLAQRLVRRRLDQFRTDLAGSESPPALERLMIDRVALTWLEVCTWDEKLTRADRLSARDDCMVFVEHMERRRMAAHKRFNQAVKALATVRRLALPRLRVKLSVQDRSGRIPLPPVSSIE